MAKQRDPNTASTSYPLRCNRLPTNFTNYKTNPRLRGAWILGAAAQTFHNGSKQLKPNFLNLLRSPSSIWKQQSRTLRTSKQTCGAAPSTARRLLGLSHENSGAHCCSQRGELQHSPPDLATLTTITNFTTTTTTTDTTINSSSILSTTTTITTTNYYDNNLQTSTRPLTSTVFDQHSCAGATNKNHRPQLGLQQGCKNSQTRLLPGHPHFLPGRPRLLRRSDAARSPSRLCLLMHMASLPEGAGRVP